MAIVVVLLGATPALGASLFDPAFRFRRLTTEHFIIYFHQGEDRLAARLADIAEDAWRNLSQALHIMPSRRTHVVLVDQSDSSNGWATPLPYNTIMVTAAWPAGSEFIGHTDDWLQIVFTHEFAHIVHLDRSEGWARLVRGIFGRTPIAFPNLFLPIWQIEGLATYEESALTGEGRLHAGDFRAIEREGARQGALEPLDRINGGITDWPNGLAPYAYGVGFHAYLAERYGGDKLAALANATARRVPYTGSRAFRRVFGRSLGALWREYQSSLAASAGGQRSDDVASRLTHHGFGVIGPRFAPPACAGCAGEIVYSVRTPHGFPALNAIALDGSLPRQLVTRYQGATVGVGRTLVVFDQQEVRRNVGLYSDLFVLDRVSGKTRALTSEARLRDPDLSPDGETIVCVREGSGRRELVLVRLEIAGLKARTTTDVTTSDDRAGGRTSITSGVVQAFRPAVANIIPLISEPETQFNAPRWSPDGRSIAVERRRRGGESEIVVVDADAKETRVVLSQPRTRLVTPAWRPDGRAIIAAADFNGGPFNVYEFDIDAKRAPRQLTNTTGGATWPDVSSDGRTLVFVGYTVEGFDLFTMPYPTPSGVVQAFRPADMPITADLKVRTTPERDAAVADRYSPWPTLKPTSWTPVIESDSDQLRLGVATGGIDVLAYHAYAASATWLVDGPSRARTSGTAALDWQIAYAYDRRRPSFFLSASTQTAFFAGPATDGGAPSDATVRERQLEAGVFLPVRHVRVRHRAIASILRSVDDYSLPDRDTSFERTAARAGWATISARTYGYSVSPEGGVAVGTTVEHVPRALGSSAEATTVTLDVRGYVPGLAAHHVLAVRGGGGASSGDIDLRRTFHLGGAGPNADVLEFGRDAFSLLRGFPANSFAGSRVAAINVDYRWPIARPQRGVGTFPLLLHTIHAAVFADAGHAWTRTFHARDVKTSAGAELSLNLVVGYALPLTVTLGAGWGHDGAQRVADRRAFYVRVGRAF